MARRSCAAADRAFGQSPARGPHKSGRAHIGAVLGHEAIEASPAVPAAVTGDL